eukprot:jgi/Tetstr1/422839/TSEL_013630.t1
MLKPATPLEKKLRPEGISVPVDGLAARRDRIPAGLLDQLVCNKHGCTVRVHPQQTPGSQLRHDFADLLERTTPDAAEWDGNKTELAGCGFCVTDDEATGESMVVAYFTCNTPVEYRASVLKAPLPPPSRGVVRVSGISSRPPKSRVTLPLADATNNMPSHAIVELQAALTKAGSKSIRHNATVLRKLRFILDSNDISIRARYISKATANIWADRLSRDIDYGDKAFILRHFNHLNNIWGRHTADRFATMEKARLPRYNSR